MFPCHPVRVLLQTEQFRQSEYPLGMVKEHRPHRMEKRRGEAGKEGRREVGRREGGSEEEKGGGGRL